MWVGKWLVQVLPVRFFLRCYSTSKIFLAVTGMTNPTLEKTFLGGELDDSESNGVSPALPVTVQRYRFSFSRLSGAAPSKKGPYRLCWGSAQTNAHPGFVAYSVEVGSILLFGPFFSHFSCVYGTSCQINVEGTGLDKATFVSPVLRSHSPDMRSHGEVARSLRAPIRIPVSTLSPTLSPAHLCCWS